MDPDMAEEEKTSERFALVKLIGELESEMPFPKRPRLDSKTSIPSRQTLDLPAEHPADNFILGLDQLEDEFVYGNSVPGVIPPPFAQVPIIREGILSSKLAYAISQVKRVSFDFTKKTVRSPMVVKAQAVRATSRGHTNLKVPEDAEMGQKARKTVKKAKRTRQG